jgi:tRNA-splicing ligase RtcB
MWTLGNRLNHFIEIQEDETGCLCIMIHSGSRNLGKKICDFYNAKAKLYDAEDAIEGLSALPIESMDGQGYLTWMNLALDFARENRQLMLNRVVAIVRDMVDKYTDFKDFELGEQINAHHNYASFEKHFGEDVIVHRKGAIYAGQGALGIIPGAMGSYSYIVSGLGNPDSFNSASHGAGRCMGRRQAYKTYPVEKVIADLKQRGVFLGMEDKNGVAEECVWAYKDIDFVIENERDLVEPIRRLKTVCVVKGSDGGRYKKKGTADVLEDQAW